MFLTEGPKFQLKQTTLQQREFNDKCLCDWHTCHACFAGDFGGYFGLLLGGSAISAFEMFDFIIYNALLKVASRRVKPQVIDVKPLQAQQV